MDPEAFVRCLSKNHMKIGQTEQAKMIEKLKDQSGQVNYKDFLKFSYLADLFKNQSRLEYAMKEADKDEQGTITVA